MCAGTEVAMRPCSPIAFGRSIKNGAPCFPLDLSPIPMAFTQP